MESCDSTDEARSLKEILNETIVTYSIDLDEEMVEDDNVMLVAMLTAQFLAQKCAGVYCVDSEGFFDETGELLYEVLS